MNDVSTIGLDLAKSVFQVHGVNAVGEPVECRQVRRARVRDYFEKRAPCLVGMEACPSAHYWARELRALGHEVRIMPAQYVKPYVKRGKNDAADAAAICEAVRRPSMRFVAVKSAEQQAGLVLHRSRALLVRQRTMLVNAIRGHMAEFGCTAAVGRRGLAALLAQLRAPEAGSLPDLARRCLMGLVAALETLEREIATLDRRLLAWREGSETCRLLETIPGLGPVLSTALTASVGDPTQFRSGRAFAAWIGLVPRQTSTGGKQRLGRICKQGDGYLRWLLVAGAMAVIRQQRKTDFKDNFWLGDLVRRKPLKVAAVALANKTARIAWAVLCSGEPYRQTAPATV